MSSNDIKIAIFLYFKIFEKSKNDLAQLFTAALKATYLFHRICGQNYSPIFKHEIIDICRFGE